MKQKVDVGSLTVAERASDQARATVAFLQRIGAAGSMADAVIGEGSYPARHFEEIYRRRANHRRALGAENSGMTRAIEDLERSTATMRVIALDVDSTHAILFVDERGEVVTGFLEPSEL